MSQAVFVYDSSAGDELSRVRGIGRYMQILHENFPDWKFGNQFQISNFKFQILINPFINFLQPPILTKRIAQRQIAVIHDLIPLKYPEHFPAGLRGKLNIFRNKLALKNYDYLIAVSEETKKDIVEILGANPQKVQVIYSTLPKLFMNHKALIMKQKNNSRFRFHASSPYCLYVGDVTWNKNLVNLARAIKIADVKCVFAGKAFLQDDSAASPWLEEFRQFRKEVEGDERFVFPGFVADEELISLYKNARVNLLVSRDEGFGFSFLEAASLGIPSVLTDIPVFQEISTDSALYASAEEPNDIAQKIKMLYKDEKLWQELKQKSRHRANHFSAEKFKESYLKVVLS